MIMLLCSLFSQMFLLEYVSQLKITFNILDCATVCTDVQAAFTSIICATLFLRTHIAPDGIDNAHLYAGFLFFASLQMFFNGIAEMTFTVSPAP